MKAVFLAVLFPFLFLGQAFSQNIRWDSTASTTVGVGTLVPIVAMPGASIAFFNACISDPCSPTRATTYTSSAATTTCPSGAQVVWQLAFNQACTSFADSKGNFGAYFHAGTYEYTVSYGGLTYGPYQFNIASGGGGPAFTVPISAPGATFGDLITSKTPIIDVRSAGAKCDGATDDHVALQAALNTPGYSNVLIPTGLTCLSSTGLTIPGNNGTTNATNSLHVDGVLRLSATISTPFITLGSATSWVAAPVGYSRGFTLAGNGIVDANFNAPIAIDIVNANGVEISVASIQNATLFGVLGGDSTVTCTAAHCYASQIGLDGGTTILLTSPTRAGSGSWGNCSTSISPPGFAPLTNAAAAICMDKSSDNVIDATVYTIGYPVGASIHSGDNRISFHPWAATFDPNVGRLQIGVDDYSNGTQISNCFIDTPQIYGVWEHGFNGVIDNCSFFELNGYTPDNVASGIFFSHPSPFASVTNNRFSGGASSRLANDVLVSGGYLGDVQFFGNIDIGNVVNTNSGPGSGGYRIYTPLNFISAANAINWNMGPDASAHFRLHDVADSLDRLIFFSGGYTFFSAPSGQGYSFISGTTTTAGFNPNGLLMGNVGATIASASTITPTGPITHVTGTAVISTITFAFGCSTAGGVGCSITLIPDGAWTTITGGDIAVALTAVPGVAITLWFDPNTDLWYPSARSVGISGTPTVNHAACIKGAGPPTVIGFCSTQPDSTGSCTCN